MEDNARYGRSVSESMWEDFSPEMDSSCLGEMHRITCEVNGMYEEINDVNEIATTEANYGNEVMIEEVTSEGIGVNEVVIEAVTDETVGVNEEVIEVVTSETIGVNEEVMEAVTDETIDVDEKTSEEEIDENTSEDDDEDFCKFRQEEKPIVKMRHFLSDENYLFVEDVIGAVQKIFKLEEENSPKQKRPQKDQQHRRAFCFTAKHKYFLKKYIESEEEDFILIISESFSTIKFCVFETYKEKFKERYKPKIYTEQGFVNFCAAIAYLGMYCSTVGLDPHAMSKATNYICSLVYDAFQRRGKLEVSSKEECEFYFKLE